MDPDELYTLRNLFWLGHYQVGSVNEFFYSSIYFILFVYIYSLLLMKLMALVN